VIQTTKKTKKKMTKTKDMTNKTVYSRLKKKKSSDGDKEENYKGKKLGKDDLEVYQDAMMNFDEERNFKRQEAMIKMQIELL